MRDLSEINQNISDRSEVFYWQTDRKISPEEAGVIWTDRHKYFTEDLLLTEVNKALAEDQLVNIIPLDLEAQTSLGNVNSVRAGKLLSGKEVIIRNHPRGIENGYFHVESLASHIVKQSGVPSYDTFAIHGLESVEDHSFQIIEKLPGIVLSKWLAQHPEDEYKLLFESGKVMAKLHKIEVKGYGPFDNKKAVEGKLEGLHSKFKNSVFASLDSNCQVLNQKGLLSAEQIAAIKNIFNNSPVLDQSRSVLVHNDFADWNLLTDGEAITGVVDFDECVGGDPVLDIACWSTFFDSSRLNKFLVGYWSVIEKPSDFEERFELLRLRYVLSKLALRLRRYEWQPTEAMKEKIEVGKKHLEESLRYFNI